MDHHPDTEHDWLGEVDFDDSEFVSSKAQFGGGQNVKPSRLSTCLNEDTYDYALLLVPDDEYRQTAASLPRISEYEDLDEELLLYGGAVGRRNSPQKNRDPHHRLSRAFLAAVRHSFGSSKRKMENDNVIAAASAIPDVEQGGISHQQHTSSTALHHHTTTDTPSPASSLSSASVLSSLQRGVNALSLSKQQQHTNSNNNNSRCRVSPELSMSQVTNLSLLSINLPTCLTFIIYPL